MRWARGREPQWEATAQKRDTLCFSALRDLVGLVQWRLLQVAINIFQPMTMTSSFGMRTIEGLERQHSSSIGICRSSFSVDSTIVLDAMFGEAGRREKERGGAGRASSLSRASGGPTPSCPSPAGFLFVPKCSAEHVPRSHFWSCAAVPSLY